MSGVNNLTGQTGTIGNPVAPQQPPAHGNVPALLSLTPKPSVSRAPLERPPSKNKSVLKAITQKQRREGKVASSKLEKNWKMVIALESFSVQLSREKKETKEAVEKNLLKLLKSNAQNNIGWEDLQKHMLKPPLPDGFAEDYKKGTNKQLITTNDHKLCLKWTVPPADSDGHQKTMLVTFDSNSSQLENQKTTEGSVDRWQLDGTSNLAKFIVIKAMRNDLVNAVVAKSAGPFVKTPLGVVGSDSLTSDYDLQIYADPWLTTSGEHPNVGSVIDPSLTTSGEHPNVGSVIEEAMNNLRGKIGGEPGFLLDSNLYDPSARLDRDDVFLDAEIAASETRVRSGKNNTKIQFSGALAKILKYATVEEAKKFKDGVCKGFENDNERKTWFVDSFENASKLLSEAEQREQAALQEYDQNPENAPVADGENRKQLGMNLCYVQELKKVHLSRVEQQSALSKIKEAKKVLSAASPPAEKKAAAQEEMAKAIKNLDKATVSLKQAMVQATLHAQEAYHTEGAMIEIVAKGQLSGAEINQYERKKGVDGISWDKKKKDPLKTKNLEKLCNYNEQFGDALKASKNDVSDKHMMSDDAKIVEASKYLSRMFKSFGEVPKAVVEAVEKILQAKKSKEEVEDEDIVMVKNQLKMNSSSRPPFREALIQKAVAQNIAVISKLVSQ